MPSFRSTINSNVSNYNPHCLPCKKSKIKETKLIHEGSMDGMHGPIDRQKITSVFEKLVKNAEPGVIFDKNYLEYDVSGGTCSAQSLSFVKHLLTSPKKDLIEKVKKVAALHQTSSIEFRTHQAAFNAICIDYHQPVQDFSKAKIASLAKLHDLAIDYSPEIELDYNDIILESNTTKFEQVVKELPQGVYLIRMICPSDRSHKKETYGHSMVFINDDDGHFFYDPNHGAAQIADDNMIHDLRKFLESVSSRWGLQKLRFYRMQHQQTTAA